MRKSAGTTDDRRMKIYTRAQVSSKKLEAVRLVSRKARAELIETIMCDDKDVLCQAEIEGIHRSLRKFLRIQKQLLTAWFKNSNADARDLMAAAGPAFGSLPEEEWHDG